MRSCSLRAVLGTMVVLAKGERIGVGRIFNALATFSMMGNPLALAGGVKVFTWGTIGPPPTDAAAWVRNGKIRSTLEVPLGLCATPNALAGLIAGNVPAIARRAKFQLFVEHVGSGDFDEISKVLAAMAIHFGE